MFGIRKKGREQSAKLHRVLRENVAPFVARLSERSRLPARKRLVVWWGRKNPWKVVASYAVFAVAAIAWNSYGLIPSGKSLKSGGDPLGFSGMASVSNPFDGMTEINVNKAAIRSTLSDIADVNLELAQRLDSLCSLESKTRKDSLEIVRIYSKLNNKTHNPNEPKTD